ncbi:hypothetical protein [Nostoc sp.]|uniref:hypothetical protein n=1 Tax=Nostoc sp. TaxID=1180 RepID=UPI002FF609D8
MFVTALDVLRLNPDLLQGTVKEGTKKLPGLGVSDIRAFYGLDVNFVSLWRRRKQIS